jgi:hypothetical protein
MGMKRALSELIVQARVAAPPNVPARKNTVPV